jgi:hypothetical protein
MSGITDLLNSAGTGIANGVSGGIGGAIGSQIGYGIGNLTGYNERLRNDQLKQQQALTSMQYAANYNLMKGSYEQQLDMWNKTNYEAQIKHLKEAGLNPALMYAKGGAGGTTGSGGASVGGGQAASSAQMQQANTAQAATGMAMMKAQSEIELNKASASKLEQDAKAQWIENNRKHFSDWYSKDSDPEQAMIYQDKKYGEHTIEYQSIWNQQNVANVTKTEAEKGNAAAQALLGNAKAMGYWQELANATKNADSQATQAAAQKLAAEFNYGEYTNWKYWVQQGTNVFKIIK